MASLLYSLSQIWPIRQALEESGNQQLPRTELSEAELRSLSKENFEIPTPSENHFSRTTSRIPRSKYLSASLPVFNRQEPRDLDLARYRPKKFDLGGSLLSSSKRRFLRARTISARTGIAHRTFTDDLEKIPTTSKSNPTCGFSNCQKSGPNIEESNQDNFSDIFISNSEAEDSTDEYHVNLHDQLKTGVNIGAGTIKKKQVMWEDSGYGSPTLKPDCEKTEQKQNAQDVFTCTMEQPQPPSDSLSLSQQADAQRFNSIVEGDFGRPDDSSGYTSLKQSLHFVRNKLPEPSESGFKKEQEEGISSIAQSVLNESIGNISGDMTPAFTSTPIKSNNVDRNTRPVPSTSYFHYRPSSVHQPVLDGHAFSRSVNDGVVGTPIDSYSSHSQFDQQQTKDVALSTTSLKDSTSGVSVSSIMKDFEEECNISKIIQDSSEEFNGKYSQWIAQIFNLQLEKLQRRLQVQFDRKLELMTREKEREILTMQQKFRNKLIEFQASTEKFQKWVESLNEENSRLRETKDAVVEEMQKSIKEQGESYRLELEKQVNNVQAECERDKLAMQKRHAEQLKGVTDNLVGQMGKMQEQQQHQIESLQNLVTELKTQNDNLEEQLSRFMKAGKAREAQFQPSKYEYESNQRSLISALELKLAHSEKDKADMAMAHKTELVKTQSEAERAVRNLSARLTSTVAETIAKRYEQESIELKRRMVAQEEQYKQALDDLRGRYGTRIEDLTNTVETLQLQLGGGNGLNR